MLGGGLGAGEAAQLRSAATIEHAGQCTALRHFVAGGTSTTGLDPATTSGASRNHLVLVEVVTRSSTAPV